MFNSIFPINLSAFWTQKEQADKCSKQIGTWLYDTGSLTKKLESICQYFHVELASQKIVEATDLNLSGYFSDTKEILVREVFLYCDNVPVIFAQTEIPISTLLGENDQLSEIGTESLGNILFQDPTMRRGLIEVAHFTEKSQLMTLETLLNQKFDHSLWARRSFFYLNEKPLLVSELFLPAAAIYLS